MSDPVFNRETGLFENVDESPAIERYTDIDYIPHGCKICDQLVIFGRLLGQPATEKSSWRKLDPGSCQQHHCSKEAMAMNGHRDRLKAEAAGYVERQRLKGPQYAYTLQQHSDHEQYIGIETDVMTRFMRQYAASKANPGWCSQNIEWTKGTDLHVDLWEVARYLGLDYQVPVPVAFQKPKQTNNDQMSNDAGMSGDASDAAGDEYEMNPYEIPACGLEKALPSQLKNVHVSYG